MQRRNCVAWEIAESDQPFKLTDFHDFPLPPLSFLHFRSFVLRKLPFRARTVPMPLSPLLRLRRASFYSLPATQWSWGLGVWVGIVTSPVALCGGSIPPVLKAAHSQTHVISSGISKTSIRCLTIPLPRLLH